MNLRQNPTTQTETLIKIFQNRREEINIRDKTEHLVTSYNSKLVFELSEYLKEISDKVNIGFDLVIAEEDTIINIPIKTKKLFLISFKLAPISTWLASEKNLKQFSKIIECNLRYISKVSGYKKSLFSLPSVNIKISTRNRYFL
jgi:hypothetical protein